MTKTNKPLVRIHNIETDEVIDREMNDTEFAEWQERQEIVAAEKVEAEAKATEKAALLARLGLTEDELKTILG